MAELDNNYKEMWANGTWTPEYKDPKTWPQCCSLPMARYNEISRRGHRCLICFKWIDCAIKCEKITQNQHEPSRQLD